MRNLLIDVFDAFENRIELVQDIISSSNDLIDNYRNERQAIDLHLRNILAQSRSLRKKDFDLMMNNVRQHYLNREKELKTVLQHFIDDHKTMVREIRNSLLTTQASGVPNITAFQQRFETIKTEQINREKMIREILNSYEEEHNSFSTVMGNLIDNDRQIDFSDVKQAIDQLLTQDVASATA